MLRRTVVRLLANDGVDQSEVWFIKKNRFRFGFKLVIEKQRRRHDVSFFVLKRIINYKNT